MISSWCWLTTIPPSSARSLYHRRISGCTLAEIPLSLPTNSCRVWAAIIAHFWFPRLWFANLRRPQCTVPLNLKLSKYRSTRALGTKEGRTPIGDKKSEAPHLRCRSHKHQRNMQSANHHHSRGPRIHVV